MCFGFKIIFKLCALFGISPYSFSERNEKIIVIRRYIVILITLIWISLYSFTLMHRIISNTYESEISKILLSFFIVTVFSHATSIVSVYTAFRKKYPSILQEISEIDVHDFSLEHSNKNVNIWKIMQVCEIMLIVIALAVTNYTGLVEYCSLPIWDFGDKVLLHLGGVCNTLLTCQYSIIILMVKSKYYVMNQFICYHLQYNKRVMNKNNNDLFVSRSSVVKSNASSLSNVRFINIIHKLRITHDKLHDVVSSINKDYGLTILLFFCWTLTLVITSLPYISEYSMLYCLYTVAILGRLPIFCHSAVSEFDNSKILIQKMILHNEFGPVANKDLKRLSSQLNSMKIEYSACGFFSLNLSFLGSVISVVVSYVLLVIQLK